MTTIRISAGIVGGGIIACVTYAGVVAAGGIGAPQAPLLIALAAGLVVGAMACGHAWHGDRKVLAIAMMTTLLLGEGYALLNIGERELEAREARQAPKTSDADRRAALNASIAKGEAALANLSSARLENGRSASRRSRRRPCRDAARGASRRSRRARQARSVTSRRRAPSSRAAAGRSR
jgi:hypothetical protein